MIDTTWRYGILKDIHKPGLRGRLPTFIENFFADRTMQVRVGSSLSDHYDQEQGVPQGSVLSSGNPFLLRFWLSCGLRSITFEGMQQFQSLPKGKTSLNKGQVRIKR